VINSKTHDYFPCPQCYQRRATLSGSESAVSPPTIA
jgi:hypothetical protein